MKAKGKKKVKSKKVKASGVREQTVPPFVLIRTYSAGVHCGYLVRQKGKEVTLYEARRIWRWRGANTLSELSQQGAAEEWTRISEPVPNIVLTEAVEIIHCSKIAQENLVRNRWGG